jgi:hypothetical protein
VALLAEITSAHLLEIMLMDASWIVYCVKVFNYGFFLIILGEVKSSIPYHYLNGYGIFYLFMLNIMILLA